MQPFLLKALHITANVLVDRLNPFQYQFPQHILADIMRRAIATPTLIFGADVMILFALKALAGGKVELAAAVCAIQQPGEQTLPFRFCGAALVFAQLLHSVPLCLRNDCLLCIRYDEHILRIVGNPLFQLVGLGVGLEVAGAAGVFLPFQNPDDGLILPSIRILWQRLSLAAGIQGFGRKNLIAFKNPGNLLRAFAVNAEIKDALDNRRGFWTTSWKSCKCCCFACRGSTRRRKQNS